VKHSDICFTVEAAWCI